MSDRIRYTAPVLLALVLFSALAVMSALGWGSCRTTSDVCASLRASDELPAQGEAMAIAGGGVVLAALGAFVLKRTGGNRVGWTFAVLGILLTLVVTEPYTVRGLVEAPGSLPGARAIATLSEVVGGPIIFTPFAVLLLLFPSGALMSQRWRVVIAVLAATAVLFAVNAIFSPGTIRLAPHVPRPLGIEALRALRPWIDLVSALLLLGAWVASIAGVVLRFKRSRGIERQQMKLLAGAGAFVGVTFLAGPIFWTLPPDHPVGRLWGMVFLTAMLTLPVAVTIAVVRHRLYDIDVVIRRTLLYTVLAVILAGTYVAGVFLLGALVDPFTGDSDVAVAATTLAVAALFRPLRGRIASFLDRRFYRSRYDARNALDELAQRMRRQVALEDISGDVIGVVRRTVLPAHAALWIRDRPT